MQTISANLRCPCMTATGGSGPPESATRLFNLMKEHDGLLLACPEYNSSITPVLKNTIDCISPAKARNRLQHFPERWLGCSCRLPCLGRSMRLVHVRSIRETWVFLSFPINWPYRAHTAFDQVAAILDPKVSTTGGCRQHRLRQTKTESR